MNWRTRPHQPIHDMMTIADGYMKAAIMLAQDCLQDNRDKKADIVGCRMTIGMIKVKGRRMSFDDNIDSKGSNKK